MHPSLHDEKTSGPFSVSPRHPGTRNLRLDIAYNGFSYHGWQQQPDVRTIQGTLEQELSVLFQKPAVVHGASRTDAGVHALGQVAHCLSDSPRPPDELRRSLNHRLPMSIQVHGISEVPADFNARKSAVGKHYRYRLWISEDKPLFETMFVYWHPGVRLDIGAMQRAARHMEGEHDYTSFAANSKRPDEVKTRHVSRVRITKHERLVEIDVFGVSFLYKMVRAMSGTLLDIGKGKPLDIPRIFEARDRKASSRTLPGHGLFLVKVYYDRGEYEEAWHRPPPETGRGF